MRRTDQLTGLEGAERKRVEAVVETLATLHSGGESLAELAHDARNMVTALGLYCDLLEEPGVLARPFAHYGSELRLVAAASRRLVEKLVSLDTREFSLDGRSAAAPAGSGRAAGRATLPGRREQPRMWELTPRFIDSLAEELLANRNLLAALAGPSVALTVETVGGALPVGLTGADLTRVLVNLVKNAAEAMPAGGRIQIHLRKAHMDGGAQRLALSIEDSGPGIPGEALDNIFEPGFTTRANNAAAGPGWPAAHRGLGLSISRSVVEAAGGRMRAANRPTGGARIEMELPVRTH